MKNCISCIYYNSDYIYDEESGEEFEVLSCDKDRDEFQNNIIDECPLFKEYPPYKEQSTECDKCDSLHKCINDKKSIECTSFGDAYRHYTKNIGVICN